MSLKLAIFMISYNQKDYILEALENVLNQEVDFDYHVFLSDDNSTDGTDVTVKLFLKNHPKRERVTFISQKKNLGWMPNFIFTLNKCVSSGAKYIAMCEGDDYWTNQKKIQKQVNILENNSDVVLSCHQYEELYNDGTTKKCPYFRKDFFQGKDYFKFSQKDFEDFMRIQTMTIVFRTSALDLSLRVKYDYYCDTHIKHHILDHGLGIYTKDFDAIYRIHGNNVFVSQDYRKKNKFTYEVYKDLIEKNNSIGYKKLLNLSMRERINLELKNNKRNLFDKYYLGLIIQQFKDVKSIGLFFKNLYKAAINI